MGSDMLYAYEDWAKHNASKFQRTLQEIRDETRRCGVSSNPNDYIKLATETVRRIDKVFGESTEAPVAPDVVEEFKTIHKTAQMNNAALDIALRYGQIDGGHHKMWVIDQMVRALTGNSYEAWVAEACDGEDGPDTYEWDEGIAP